MVAKFITFPNRREQYINHLSLLRSENVLNIDVFNACAFEGCDRKETIVVYPVALEQYDANANKMLKFSDNLSDTPFHSVVKNWSSDSNPVLALPTKRMERWDAAVNNQEKQMVDQAIATIFRAAGAGYTIAVPIRYHDQVTSKINHFEYLYTDSSLIPIEYNLWDADDLHQPLIAYYCQQLNKLSSLLVTIEKDSNTGRPLYLPTPESQRLSDISIGVEDPFYRAFLDGTLQRIRQDDWIENPPLFIEQSSLLSKAHDDFIALRQQLSIKVDELLIRAASKTKNFSQALKNKSALWQAIKLEEALYQAQRQCFMPDGRCDMTLLQQQCRDAINDARDEFNNHRGFWNDFPMWIKYTLGVLAIITVVPALVIRKKSSAGFFATCFSTSPQTDSDKKLDEFSQGLDKLCDDYLSSQRVQLP